LWLRAAARYYGFLQQYSSCIESHFNAPLTTAAMLTTLTNQGYDYYPASEVGYDVVDVGMVVGLAVGFVVLAGIAAIIIVLLKKNTARSAAYTTSSVKQLKVVTHLQNVDKA
jgi:hypothetical protein